MIFRYTCMDAPTSGNGMKIRYLRKKSKGREGLGNQSKISEKRSPYSRRGVKEFEFKFIAVWPYL